VSLSFLLLNIFFLSKIINTYSNIIGSSRSLVTSSLYGIKVSFSFYIAIIIIIIIIILKRKELVSMLDQCEEGYGKNGDKRLEMEGIVKI
jgi:hypothetical protein